MALLMAHGLPGGSISGSAGRRLAGRMDALKAQRGTHNAAPSKMADFNEKTKDEGHGRLAGKLKPDHINERKYQRHGPPASRGAGVERPRGTDSGPDHIDKSANAKHWPPGDLARRGKARSKVKGKVMPSPRRFLQGAPRREYEEREGREGREHERRERR